MPKTTFFCSLKKNVHNKNYHCISVLWFMLYVCCSNSPWFTDYLKLCSPRDKFCVFLGYWQFKCNVSKRKWRDLNFGEIQKLLTSRAASRQESGLAQRHTAAAIVWFIFGQALFPRGHIRGNNEVQHNWCILTTYCKQRLNYTNACTACTPKHQHKGEP